MTHQLHNKTFELAKDNNSPELGKVKHQPRVNNQNKINKNKNNKSTDQLKSCINKSDERLGPYDILCGRGRRSWNNVGNRRFRVIVNLNLKRYSDAPRRQDKSAVIQSIITMIQQDMGGRFLKPKNGELIELGKRETHEKVGHALRDLQNAQQNDTSSLYGSEDSTSSSIGITGHQEDPNSMLKPDLLLSRALQGNSNNQPPCQVDAMCFNISVKNEDVHSALDVDSQFADPFWWDTVNISTIYTRQDMELFYAQRLYTFKILWILYIHATFLMD